MYYGLDQCVVHFTTVKKRNPRIKNLAVLNWPKNVKERSIQPTMYFDILPTVEEMEAINMKIEDSSAIESTPPITKNLNEAT